MNPPARSESAHPALDLLVSGIDQAFDGDPHQSLLANLRRLRSEDWDATPPNGARTISDILEHVGWAKWMYTDYAFGAATMRGDQPPLVPDNGARARPRDELLQWIATGHHQWRYTVAALASDAELDRARMTNWGEWVPTRLIVQRLIAHDFYHAGEINHLRAVLQRDDRWRYETAR